MENKILRKGERVYIRKITMEDVTQEYCDGINDPEVHENLATKQTTMEELKEYVKVRLNKRDVLFVAVCLNDTDEHIGNMKLEPIEYRKMMQDGNVQKIADFGICLWVKKHWGKGYGSEAQKLLLDYAISLDGLDLDRIYLGVWGANERAVKSYARAGWKEIKHFEYRRNFK